jgi:hypothetical protein
MHKVRVNYSSCTCRSSENIYVAAVEALRKTETGGQNWMKLSLAQKKSGAFLSFTPRLEG